MSVHQLARPVAADPPEAFAQGMERIRAQAAELAQAHTGDFLQALTLALGHADGIAEGGEAYDVGVREIARSLAIELRGAALGIESLRQRAAERRTTSARRAVALRRG